VRLEHFDEGDIAGVDVVGVPGCEVAHRYGLVTVQNIAPFALGGRLRRDFREVLLEFDLDVVAGSDGDRSAGDVGTGLRIAEDSSIRIKSLDLQRTGRLWKPRRERRVFPPPGYPGA